MKTGDKVSVWCPGGQWRDAILLYKSGYKGKASAGDEHQFWEYVFDPMPIRDPATGIRPSIGGASCYFKEREKQS